MALISVKDSTRRQLAATRKKLKYDTICKKIIWLKPTTSLGIFYNRSYQFWILISVKNTKKKIRTMSVAKNSFRVLIEGQFIQWLSAAV